MIKKQIVTLLGLIIILEVDAAPIKLHPPVPKKHLIAQQVEGGAAQGTVDFSADPRISVIVGQYTGQDVNQVGAFKLLDNDSKLGKVIEFNETVIYPTGYMKGNALDDSRVEAWEFIIGGEGSFNQLNSLYTTHNEDAGGTDNDKILNQLKVLKTFMNNLNYIKMRQNKAFSISGSKFKPNARGICEPGKQYAFYLHHSKNPNDSTSSYIHYETGPGKYREDITFSLPKGTYRADWVNPSSGVIIKSVYFTGKKASHKLTSPEYSIDIALRVIKIL